MSNRYDCRLRLRRFRGIMQRDGLDGQQMEYAAQAENCDTTGGSLCPARSPLEAYEPLPAAVGTLARFHRRYHADGAGDVLVAAAGGALYAMAEDGEAWQRIAEGYQSDDWDWVTYEVNPEGSEAPTDVLILSNAKDGMICIYGDDFRVVGIETPKKFGAISRHAERIWGSAIEDDPDMLVYSAPFDPFNWEQDSDYPEDGAGDILQPSWDGDRFIALRNWGEYLLAFKRDSVWRVLGTDPGQYTMVQQYGEDSAIVENSIATERDMVFMLYERGISIYDGSGVRPFDLGAARGIFERVNQAAIGGAAAVCFRHKYLLALPIDGSMDNNAVLEYDTLEGYWMLRTGIGVAAFAKSGQRLLMTSPGEPGRIYAYDEGAAQPMLWKTPVTDLGAPETRKGGMILYATLESRDETEIRLGYEDEGRSRTRRVKLSPGAQRRCRLHLPGSGKRFRLVVEADGGAMWKMRGGLSVTVDMESE